MTRYTYGETPWAIEGPHAVWEDTTAEFTPEIRARFQEAAKTRTMPKCPQCDELVDEFHQESVSVQQTIASAYKEVGTLITLGPCGHRMKTVA